MNRIVRAALAAIVALSVTGCSRFAASPASTGPTSVTSAALAATVPTAKTWNAMPLGVQERKRLRTLAEPLGLYTEEYKKVGRLPVDVTGMDPRFVGYQVEVWSARPGGKFQLTYIDVIDGQVAAVGGAQSSPATRSVNVLQDQRTRYASGVTPKSTGEKEAVGAAVTWAGTAFPGFKWNAEIAGYDFYYDLGKGTYFLFTGIASGYGYRVLEGSTGR